MGTIMDRQIPLTPHSKALLEHRDDTRPSPVGAHARGGCPKARLNAIRLRTHRLIAEKIDDDPSLLEIPQRNLDRWRERLQGEDLPAWAEWRALLKQPWEKIRALIVADTEEAVRLRLSTPFAGILSQRERWRVHETTTA